MELNGCGVQNTPEEGNAGAWLDFHLTVRGASHIRKGAACQDYSRSVRFGNCAAAAVADGHGDPRYFRSRLGARFAVDAALKAIREFIRRENGIPARNCAEEKMTQLKKNIIWNWNEKVGGHLAEHPFLEEELMPLSEKRRARLLQGKDTESAYGTTLIAAAVTPRFWFGVQIGDGDCAAHTAEGGFVSVPRKSGLVANITTSLCEPDAIDSFFHCYEESLPEYILLSTDGVRNSFDSGENYYKFLEKVASVYSSESPDRTQAFLKSFLREMTGRGSGDDLSLAGLVGTRCGGSPERDRERIAAGHGASGEIAG